jgi:hypothetical protein
VKAKKVKKDGKATISVSRKLIDRLVPKAKEDLQAFLATTYEFDAEFLETDFLPSLLGLGAWDDRNWTSRIEIEKHLASTEAAAVFLDQACYRTRPRSLRVGVYPIQVGHGRILHAKVTLLVYAESIRLIVGSANLTEFGYRKNREIVASLRTSPSDQAQAPLIRQAIAGLQTHLAEAWNDAAECAANLALTKLDAWATGPAVDDSTWFAWSGAADKPLWQQVIDRWPAGERAHAISIVSPFWSEEDGRGPIGQLITELRARDQLAPGTRLRLLADAQPAANDTYLPILPDSFGRWNASSLDVVATAAAVDPAVLPEEVDGMEEFRGTRKLHAKVVVIAGPTTTLAYLGSANFTHHGWGFDEGGAGNLEAGIVQRATGKERERLELLLPGIAGAEVPLDGAAGDRLALLPRIEPAAPWPGFIRALTLVPGETNVDEPRLVLELVVVPDEIQGAWTLGLAGADTLLFSGSPSSAATSRIELGHDRLERLLAEQEVVVRWWSHPEGARVPVNVSLEARFALPMTPGSARPGEHLLLAYYQGRIAWEALYPAPGQDALAKAATPAAVSSEVDTSKIQAYQVREFVEALQGIRDDLKAASCSPGTMRLAVLGPVSPVALAGHIADAVSRGTRTPMAGAFQLVELASRLDEAARIPVERDQPVWLALLAQARTQVLARLAEVERLHPDVFPPDGAFRKFQRSLDRFHRPEAAS